jgi:hypothetical protein
MNRQRCITAKDAECGMKAVLRPDGSTGFDDGSGIAVRISTDVPLNTSRVPRCK